MSLNIEEIYLKVKNNKPLVHHITNWVTISDCAQVVKNFGASPVMAHAKEEAADMANIASAVVLNIGTLTTDLVEAMILAAEAANIKNIPVVLDVCGAGATKFRNQKIEEILQTVQINIIKGNASEIASVAGLEVETRGVDSGEVKNDLISVAKNLALKLGCTVVITGAEDICTNGREVYLVKNGTPLMGQIVGTGCMATSVIGLFAAVEPDLAKAAAVGLAFYEVAGEIATEVAKGPGDFTEKLFNAISKLTSEQVLARQKIMIS